MAHWFGYKQISKNSSLIGSPVLVGPFDTLAKANSARNQAIAPDLLFTSILRADSEERARAAMAVECWTKL